MQKERVGVMVLDCAARSRPAEAEGERSLEVVSRVGVERTCGLRQRRREPTVL